LIIFNVAVVVLDLLYLFPERAEPVIFYIEVVTVVVFTAEYILRLWTADLLYPKINPGLARLRYARSPMAIVDVIAVFPFYLPYAFPINMIVLRLLRLLRLLRVLKLNRYSDSKTSEIVLSSIRESIVLMDANHNFLNANESAKKLFPSFKCIKKYTPVKLIDNWPAVLTGFDEKNVGDIRFDMGECFYKANISMIYDREKPLRYIVIIQDITESVRLEKAEKELVKSKVEMLEMTANMDALTGIHNRRYFMESAVRITEESDGLMAFIVLFDLDHFKRVNDTYGHHGGDKVLIDVAKRVKGSVRPTDLFARYGGEEFILLMITASEKAVNERIEHVRLNICETPVDFEGVEIPVSASFGIAPIMFDDTLEASIANADQALYTAKKEGRNRVVFYDSKMDGVNQA
jgi:diguanylate cyclase (GGDEF)-like protein